MTKIAHVTSVLQSQLLSKTFGIFKVLSATRDSITVHDNGTQTTVLMDRGKLARLGAQCGDKTDQANDLSATEMAPNDN